jgi:hypothetical protein
LIRPARSFSIHCSRSPVVDMGIYGIYGTLLTGLTTIVIGVEK